MTALDACDSFVIADEDKARIGSPRAVPWMRCQTCNHPRARHEDPRCHSQAIAAGVLYTCTRRTPHDGAHQEGDTQWGMG